MKGLRHKTQTCDKRENTETQGEKQSPECSGRSFWHRGRSNNGCRKIVGHQRKQRARNTKRKTYDVDELTEPEPEFDGKFVGVVADGADEFVVAVSPQQIIVQTLRIRVALHSCKERKTDFENSESCQKRQQAQTDQASRPWRGMSTKQFPHSVEQHQRFPVQFWTTWFLLELFSGWVHRIFKHVSFQKSWRMKNQFQEEQKAFWHQNTTDTTNAYERGISCKRNTHCGLIQPI